MAVENTSVGFVGGKAFDDFLADDVAAAVTRGERSASEDHNTAPQAAITACHGLLTGVGIADGKSVTLRNRGDDNRRGGGAFRDDLSATGNKDRAVGVIGLAFQVRAFVGIRVNGGAWFDDQGCAVFNEDDVGKIPIVAVGTGFDDVNAGRQWAGRAVIVDGGLDCIGRATRERSQVRVDVEISRTDSGREAHHRGKCHEFCGWFHNIKGVRGTRTRG